MNIRSINSNRVDLQAFLENLNTKFDVIALSEIGKTNVKENASFFRNYNFYWHESETKLGGTGLFVQKKLNVICERPDLEILSKHQSCKNYQVENIWIECVTATLKKPIIIGVVYRHPSGNIHLFNEEMERVLQQINKEEKLCVICGDFNIDIKNETHEQSKNFMNLMIAENYIPYITCPTRITDKSMTLIDNIFVYHTPSNIDENITSGNLLTDISDHLPNFLIYGENKSPDEIERPFVRIFSENNIKRFKQHIEDEDTWRKFLQENDCEAATEEYLNIVGAAYENFFPLTRVSRKRFKDKKWMTKAIRMSCMKKNKLFRKYVKNPTDENKTKWKKYSNCLKATCRKAEEQYFREMINDTAGSLKKLWDNFRTIFQDKKNSRRIEKIVIDGTLYTEGNDIANEFNNYFCKIGNKLSEAIPLNDVPVKKYLPSSNKKSMFFNPITDSEVIKEIAKLNNRKAIGYGDIPVKLLKNCKHELGKRLAHIYNMSIDQGIFPKVMKIARVLPIYKSNERYMVQNYRPISVLSTISKVFERLVHKRLYQFLEKYELLYSRQYGFRNKRSTVHALIDVTEKIKTALDSDELAIGIYLDLKKAFDTVNHKILLEKMYNYGIRGQVYRWFSSYLSERQQFVQVNGCDSQSKCINCGVPQGSVLGPLLFILYVNDIGNCLSEGDGQLLLFADDTNVLMKGRILNELKHRTSTVMDKLYDWLCSNKLTLNVLKTNYCIFHSKKHKIPESVNEIVFGNVHVLCRVETVKYLGMYINETLDWKLHVDAIAKSMIRTAGTFKFIRNRVPNQCKTQLYYAYCYSKLLYGIEVYGDLKRSLVDKLQVLQNKVLKILFRKDWFTSTNLLHKDLCLLKFEDIYKLSVLKFVKKFKKCELPNVFNNLFRERSTIHVYNTRFAANFEIPIFRTRMFGQKTLQYNGPKIYNEISTKISGINELPVKKFCNEIKKMYLSQY